MNNYELYLNIVLSIIFTFLGVFVGMMVDNIRTNFKFRQELKDNNFIDVTGKDWFAAWHTSVENTLNLNTENLSFEQKGQTVKVKNLERAPENPKGGYFWEAQLQFFMAKL